MARGSLGFGWMRLPLLSDDPTDIDFEQVKQMVDEYLAAGFTYFDTSHVYHNGKSENAIKVCLTSRYPREKYFLASKLPAFAITEEAQVEKIFAEQLAACGVEYFDNFLLHNLNWIRYQREVQSCHMFDHMKAWKAAGKIRHIGFSYHDDAAHLDQILTEHPEVEFVQIVVNYFDWESSFIQAKKCYAAIRKHGCQVVVMEPVKGGMLAKAPAAAEKLLKEAAPNLSVASWAIRFAAGLDGVQAVLSGMSDLTQLRDNMGYMEDFAPLTEKEYALLEKVKTIYEESGPVGTADYSRYADFPARGVSLAAILETYNHMELQPVPSFAAEANYFSTEKAKQGMRMDAPCLPEKVVVDDEDISKLAHTAEKFLTDTAFFKYEPLK